jgi:threonine/homoserine/homoserine lactone efflux protein
MFGIHAFPLFLLSGVLLNLAPGPDTAYILGRSIAQGRRAGVASALGIAVGCLGHTAAAALGLSAFLATSASAFTVVKLIGGAYLIFLGIRIILAQAEPFQLQAGFRRAGSAAAFRQGILTNLLNPKVALFFLAFLPQFIDPASSVKVLAFLTLGLTFVATGALWCLILAWFAGAFGDRLRGNRRIAQWLNRAVGSLFVFLGTRLATAR